MKYRRKLGFAAAVAAALMAFVGAGTASATKLYSGGTGLGPGTKIESSLEGSSFLKSSGGSTLNTCTGGQFKGETANTGGAGETVNGPNATIHFENCASTVHTEKLGSFEIHHIAGTDDGTFTVTGLVLGHTIFSTNCLYASGAGKNLGTLHGSSPAVININATVTEAEPKKFICPDTATWEATFKVTSPSPLHVTAS